MGERIRQSDLPTVGALAYLGDAVYGYLVRRELVGRGMPRAEELNRTALSFVTAEAQSAFFRLLEPKLTEDERAVARRALNSGHLRCPRHASGADYRRATALEAVFGMLDWLGDRERIDDLFRQILQEETEKEKGITER